MKILCICPSKYPKKLDKMMDSFLITRSKHTKIILNYENKSITSIFNEEFEKHPDYDFYFMANDDILFETPLWDLKLANKCKISYGDDGFQGENLCTFPMIDGDIVRALGWLQMPLLKRYSGDVVWKYIGERCGILNYCKDVIITHKWEGCSDPELNIKDMSNFIRWLPNSYKDIIKIKNHLGKEIKT